MIGVGIYGLLPWGGASTILRKAEKNPDVLIWDPERRRARARRIAIFQTPIWILFGGVVGYVIDGWGFAVALAALFGVSAGIVSWRILHGQ